MKTRIGIFFGGASREREVSFAGGRTVYDNLDKALFEAIPLFVDSFGNFVILNWEFIYKGSIRDFYPPVEMVHPSKHEFQVYAENIGELTTQEQVKLVNRVGAKVEASALPELIDFAFLCLHGNDGEDGRIQGLLEFYRIPYSGSGIISSAIGMNKAVQKELMAKAGFDVPSYLIIKRNEWLSSKDKKFFFEEVKANIGTPFVVKAANQGSSIGISIVHEWNQEHFTEAVNKSFFTLDLKKSDWDKLDYDGKVNRVREITDIREGIGAPLVIANRIIFHPEELLSVLVQLFADGESSVFMRSVEGESEVLIEQFIDGKEFSCIVIQNLDGKAVSLPPTEIRKGKELFDYRSKYLPGLSRKITPIDLPDQQIEDIRKRCENLFYALQFKVYARIDGFITASGKVFLNDPNTTSGMMPSSFFFHQAAEIGLNPSQFITYIIHTSLTQRLDDLKFYKTIPKIISNLNRAIQEKKKTVSKKTRIAVIMGGYSSERHISVESGRNIYEKLSSSEKYQPFPVFLTGNDEEHVLYQVPINLMLKDNADDIQEKINHFHIHPVIKKIIEQCTEITKLFASADNLASPKKLSYDELTSIADGVFIALHGRPGEDGAIQKELIKVGLPFNGSGVESSQVTIDKFRTNEILMQHGLHAASHLQVFESDWSSDPSSFEEKIVSQFKFPLIAKPVDDGCSSAVKVIRNENELHAYAEMIFRKTEAFVPAAASLLKLQPKEEFPRKKSFLVEELIMSKGAKHFLEITGGMLTHYKEDGEIEYELFEPSETLREGDVLSLEEKFLAGEGQNITPARFSKNVMENRVYSEVVKRELEKAARLLNIEGYARIDAFVRISESDKIDVLFVEVNSLPGMTPATCIFHQAAISHYKPYEFIDKIIDYAFKRRQKMKA